MEVKKDTSDKALNLQVTPDEDEKGGKIEIVDSYGEPVEKLNNPVKISVPKKAFEKEVAFGSKDDKIDVKEEDDKYVFETDKSSVEYKTEGKEEPSQSNDASSKETSSQSSSNEQETNKTENKSNKTLIIIAVAVVAAVVAIFSRKKKN